MNAKVLGALAAVALLAACAEKKPEMAAASGAGAATMPTIVPGSQEDLVKNVGDRVFFDFNKSTLSSEDKATLDRQSAWLGKYGQVNVQIAGNCDERGTEEYNIALGQRRANAARDYLVAKGTPAARMTTISFGKDRPTCTESTEACWAQNRNAITSVK
jgi:peptidoglycan-associated lipoprotein